MSRIKINDLPTLEDMSPEQLKELFGAGKFTPQMEALEDRLVRAGGLSHAGDVVSIEPPKFDRTAIVDSSVPTATKDDIAQAAVVSRNGGIVRVDPLKEHLSSGDPGRPHQENDGGGLTVNKATDPHGSVLDHKQVDGPTDLLGDIGVGGADSDTRMDDLPGAAEKDIDNLLETVDEFMDAKLSGPDVSDGLPGHDKSGLPIDMPDISDGSEAGDLDGTDLVGNKGGGDDSMGKIWNEKRDAILNDDSMSQSEKEDAMTNLASRVQKVTDGGEGEEAEASTDGGTSEGEGTGEKTKAEAGSEASKKELVSNFGTAKGDQQVWDAEKGEMVVVKHGTKAKGKNYATENAQMEKTKTKAGSKPTEDVSPEEGYLYGKAADVLNEEQMAIYLKGKLGNDIDYGEDERGPTTKLTKTDKWGNEGTDLISDGGGENFGSVPVRERNTGDIDPQEN